MGLKKTTLSLLKGVTFGLVCVWVKSNWDNVTEFEVFFFEGVPNETWIDSTIIMLNSYFPENNFSPMSANHRRS